MKIRVGVAGPSAGERIFDVDVEPDDEVRRLLAETAGEQLVPPIKVDGKTVRIDEKITGAEVRYGSYLSHGQDVARGDDRYWLTELGDPVGSSVIELPLGRYQAGREVGRILIADPRVSTTHAQFVVDEGGVQITDLGSSNGTFVDGVRITGETTVGIGSLVQLGDTRLVLQGVGEGGGSVKSTATGESWFNRPARFVEPLDLVNFSSVSRAADEKLAGFSWPTLAGPLLAGLIGWFVFRRPEMLALMASGPLASGVHFWWNRRKARQRVLEEGSATEDLIAGTAESVERAVEVERAWRLDKHPSAAESASLMRGPSPRLWERRPSDDDFLSVRVGLAQVVADGLTVDGDSVLLEDCPRTLDIVAAGVCGISGPGSQGLELCRAMLTNLAALHSPEEVAVAALIADPDERELWSWLPHVRSASDAPFVCDPLSPEPLEAILKDLREILEARQEVMNQGDGVVLPYLLVVAEGARDLRRYGEFLKLLTEGPSVRIHVIAIEQEFVNLPEEVQMQISLGERPTIRKVREKTSPLSIVDSIDAITAERAFRSIAHLELASGGPGGIASNVRLIDLIDCSVEGIRSRWSNPGELNVPIGVTEHDTMHVDIVNDGPHAMLAGTTGSGKTELLQTLLTSMALFAPPDRLGFVIVDFKGGGDFEDIKKLPHTRAVVSNLDESAAQRAIWSLKAELARRTQELNELRSLQLISAANTGVTWQEAPEEASIRSLGRLIIVVDEFAELARKFPSFLDELAAIAEQGRSAGIHLIAAAQKPKGSIPPSIQANTLLRIVLRTAPGESVAVIDEATADFIPRSKMGRGIVRLGGVGRTIAFQTARVGGRSSGRSVTDLSVIADTIAEVSAGLPIMSSPLAPLLPVGAARGETIGQSAWVRVDSPKARAILDRQYDLHANTVSGNVAIIGARETGKTTALLSYAAARVAGSSAPIEVVGVDFGGGGLAPLRTAPFTSGYVDNDAGHLERYLDRLIELLQGRRKNESERTEILVVVDNWSAITADLFATDDVWINLERLLRDGPSMGITFAVSGGESMFRERLSKQIETRLVLGKPHQDLLTDIGIRSSDVPTDPPAGRGFLVGDGSLIQVHPPLPFDTLTGPQNQAASVEPIPTYVTAEDAPKMNKSGSMLAAIGIGGWDLERLTVDLAQLGGGFLIAGRRGSGKTNSLIEAGKSLVLGGCQIFSISGSRVSSLASLEESSAHYHVGEIEPDALVATLKALVGPVVFLIDDAPTFGPVAHGNVEHAVNLIGAYAREVGPANAAVIVTGSVEALYGNKSQAVSLARECSAGLILDGVGNAARALFDLHDVPDRLEKPGVEGRGALAIRGRLTELQVPLHL